MPPLTSTRGLDRLGPNHLSAGRRLLFEPAYYEPWPTGNSVSYQPETLVFLYLRFEHLTYHVIRLLYDENTSAPGESTHHVLSLPYSQVTLSESPSQPTVGHTAVQGYNQASLGQLSECNFFAIEGFNDYSERY